MQLYVREWRIYLGFEQSEVAEGTGMEQSQVSRIETSGKARVATLKKLAEFFKIDQSQLYHPPPTPDTQVFDLRKWLDDPNAKWNGKPVSEEDKKVVEAIFRRLYSEQEKR